MEVDGAHVRIS